MAVVTCKNIIFVKHENAANTEGKKLAASMLAAAQQADNAHAQLAIFHDAEKLTQVNLDYAKAFAESFRAMQKLKATILQVAVVKRAVNRVLAKVAANLAGIDLHIYAHKEAALAKLQQHGFRPEDCLSAH